MDEAVFTHRRNLLPYLAKRLSAKTYLEIGVKGSRTLLPIRVRKKVAVDPVFRIKRKVKNSEILKYPFNFFAQYFECTSNDFFEKHAPTDNEKDPACHKTQFD